MLLAFVGLVTVLVAICICVSVEAFASAAWLWVLPLGLVGGLVAGLVLVFLAVWLLCLPVRLDRPQKKDSPVYRWLIHQLINTVMRVGRIRVHAEGLEKAPENGRFVLVCNHTHDSDPVVLMRCLPRSQLAFISKQENSKKFLLGKLQHKILCQPINRENDREALKTILRCVRLIREDLVSVGVFPEGYIHKDRKLHHFRFGVLKIAQRAKVPIVVCTLKNTKYIFRNLVRLKPTEVEMHLLEVIPVETVLSHTTIELGERIYNTMARDLGPELVADPLYEETP